MYKIILTVLVFSIIFVAQEHVQSPIVAMFLVSQDLRSLYILLHHV